MEFNTEVGRENMKGKMKMIILGVKNSESEIEHNSVLCTLQNGSGMLDSLIAQYSRRGPCQGFAVLGL